MTGSWIASDFSIAGVGGTLFDTLTAWALPELSVGDFEWLECACDPGPSNPTAVGTGEAFLSTSWALNDAGELVADDLIGAGNGCDVKGGAVLTGGGKGAMPTPVLSLAAAAAAADAYFRVSPGRRLGRGAGFMVLSLGIDGGGGMLFSVASAGKGDLSCVDGLLAEECSAFDFFRGTGSGSMSS